MGRNGTGAGDANEAISTTAAGAGGRVDRCVELVAVDQLTPYKANARTHSREQIRKIAESIQALGFNSPILVDEKGEILAGHGRLEAAKFLGLKEVATLRISHLSAPEKRAYLLADNRTAELAKWDRDLLATEFGDLLELDFEVELTGFNLDEIQEILDIPDEDAPEKDRVEADGAENDVLEPDSHVPVSLAGDIGSSVATLPTIAPMSRWMASSVIGRFWPKAQQPLPALPKPSRKSRKSGTDGAMPVPISRCRQNVRPPDAENRQQRSARARRSARV